MSPALAHFAVRQQLGNFRKNFQVLLGGLLRHQQEDQQRYRLAVGRFERNGFGQAHESCQRLLQALDAAVRNGHARAKAGGTERFAREEVVGTVARATPWLFSNRSPACSKTRFLLVTVTPRLMLPGGSNLANDSWAMHEKSGWRSRRA
jgi:hypothetical protein